MEGWQFQANISWKSNQNQQGNQWGNQGNQQGNNWGNQQGNQWGNQQQGNQWGNQQGNQWGNQQQGNQGQNGGLISNLQGSLMGTFTPVEGQLYKIRSGLNNNLVLDVSQNHQDMNKMIIWQDNNGANQKFTFKSVGNGLWGIFCVKNGLTLELPSGNQGTRAHVHQPNKQENEFWSLIPANKINFIGRNAFNLKAFSGCVLDVFGGKGQNGAQVGIWSANGGDNQVWIIEQTH